MEKVLNFFLDMLPSIIVGLFAFYWQRGQKKRDEATDVNREARREEAILMMQMQWASNKLSYAVAMALKRGSPNGEVEKGIASYESAKKAYREFLNKQALDHLHDFD